MQRGVIGQATCDGDHVGMFQEHKAAVAVVVRERAEWLWTQRHLWVELESPFAHAQ